MSPLTLEFLEKLPKTDLHCHLDGCLRVNTILDLADKQKVKLPADNADACSSSSTPVSAAARSTTTSRRSTSRSRCLQTEESLYRAAYELAEDCARENVRYLEVRYSPMLHTQRGLQAGADRRGGDSGPARRRARLRRALGRHPVRHPLDRSAMSLRMAELCVAFKNRGVVAFDLAGAEYNYPAKDHKQAFQLILDNNVNCTAHAGEAYGPESIAQAIHYCGAHRIGHGTRLRENGDLLNYCNDHRIPLEICLSSNIQTRRGSGSRLASAAVLLHATACASPSTPTIGW